MVFRRTSAAGLPEEVGGRMEADRVVRWLAKQLRQQLFRDAYGPPGVWFQLPLSSALDPS
jgi:hypothetical protein